MKKFVVFLFILAVLGIVYFSFRDAIKFVSSVDLNPQDTKLYLVKRVIDGDTIELDNGDKVRYIGINTPETVDPRKPVECFGKEASAKNKELVEWKLVRLEKDVSDKDQYGRLLRYVYVTDIFVNDQLVHDGYAQVSTFPPDVKYKDLFLASQTYARENNLGLWKSCPVKP